MVVDLKLRNNILYGGDCPPKHLSISKVTEPIDCHNDTKKSEYVDLISKIGNRVIKRPLYIPTYEDLVINE